MIQTVQKFKNMNRSPIFSYEVLILYYGKRIKILHGCPLECRHPSPFCQKGWDGCALLGQPSKGHPCMISILAPPSWRNSGGRRRFRVIQFALSWVRSPVATYEKEISVEHKILLKSGVGEMITPIFTSTIGARPNSLNRKPP